MSLKAGPSRVPTCALCSESTPSVRDCPDCGMSLCQEHQCECQRKRHRSESPEAQRKKTSKKTCFLCSESNPSVGDCPTCGIHLCQGHLAKTICKNHHKDIDQVNTFLLTNLFYYRKKYVHPVKAMDIADHPMELVLNKSLLKRKRYKLLN
jgi:hypothetical protein